jgi:crossover junction endodeoxyribonuclease RusA
VTLFAETAPVAAAPEAVATGVPRLPAPVLDIFTTGTAQPKGSKAMVRIGKGANVKTIQIESADLKGKGPRTRKVKMALTDWSAAVERDARSAWTGRAPLDEPVYIAFEFCQTRSTTFRLWQSYKSTAPDADKLTRAVGDALKKAGVLIEDSRIVDLRAVKRLCEKGQEPGVRVRVWPLGEWERGGWIVEIPSHPVLVRKDGAA